MSTQIRSTFVEKLKELREIRMVSPIFLLFFFQEVHSYETTTLAPEPTSSEWRSSTSTAATTTASSLYCGADKCDRHAIFIYDLEQKVNNLTRGFEILQNQNQQLQNDTRDLRSEIEILKDDNEDLNRENKMIKGDLKILKEENSKLKSDNEVLKDVKELQG